MSEKIVQLNEEIIKAQIKELVRGSVEETLNELLEKEAESLRHRPPATSAARLVRATAAAIMTATSPRPPVTSCSTCRGSRACPSRQPSSSGIVAGRAAWRKRSSRCIWQASPCAVWRTSPRPCGAARFRPLPSAS